MTAFKSDFLNVLQSRGFVHQISDPDSLDALAARRELVAYIGFDCTAPSLHVGSMVQIMCLYWLQQTGNRPIALMGGGTTRVGDPSGKDETRKILSIEEIERNKEGIKRVFSRFLTFGEGKSDAVMPDNAEWLTKLNWIEMLRDIGGTEIMHDRNMDGFRKRRCIADLDRHPLGGTVQHGLAVEADDVDVLASDAILRDEAGHRLGMRHGNGALGLLQNARPRITLRQIGGFGQRLEQQTPLELAVRPVPRRTKRLDPLAIGFDQGNIDPVERGPAHQTDSR